jgi:AhpD family alkylhydroperoxidase
METKTKWLIAVGAALTANCQPCLKTIVKKALESGAEKKEIAEAIGVAKVVRKNANTQMDRFAEVYWKWKSARTTKARVGARKLVG